jgi:hypothetical protein
LARTKLNCAMKVHINRIVRVERMPFCFRDFLDFEVNGERYIMTHGTFRNKISKLVKEGCVQFEYRSDIAFYSLKGVHFAKPKLEMTDNHAVVPSLSLPSSLSSYNFIENLPPDKYAVHDIRLKFRLENI